MPEKERESELDTQQVTAALIRAAKRARRVAAQTGTAIVIRRDGKLVREYPSSTDDDNKPAQSA